jgi:uncharacterized protein
MAQILGRIFRVPVAQKPITILELTGIPHEIVNVVVSVLCRMTFDFALWSEGQVPVTLVCEEAHRYVPANSSMGFEPCKRAIAKIAKEGRKYGASLCIVTQRPAEIDPTILSQCNTVFALRMSNDRDQEIVTSAIADTGSGLLEFLPALGQREAIAFGDGVALPTRIKFDELAKSNMPRSSTARFSERWQKSVGNEGFLEGVVERWRASSSGALDGTANLAMFADTMGIVAEEASIAPVAIDQAAQDAEQVGTVPQTGELEMAAAPAASNVGPRMTAPPPVPQQAARPGLPQAPAGQPAPRVAGSLLRREAPAGAPPPRPHSPPPPPPAGEPAGSSSLRSLREKLLQKR